MTGIDQDEHNAAGRDGRSPAFELIGGAFVAVATLLGALVDLQSSGNSRSIAWELLAFVVVVAAVILILRKRGRLTGRHFTRALVFVIFGAVLASGVVAINFWKSKYRSEPITISSVTIDEYGVHPGGDLKLNRFPKVNCACEVAGSVLRTGDVVRAHCQTQGETIYNAKLIENAIRNDAFFKSQRWYRATDAQGRSGYISEVRVEPAYRGGLDLPDCRRG